MFRISNNDFKILIKYKNFLNNLDDILENVPRKDMYFKDKIRSVSLRCLENIFYASYNESNIDDYTTLIKGDLAMLDFLLERLFLKKYISEKALYKIGNDLIEINRMTTSWLKGLQDGD